MKTSTLLAASILALGLLVSRGARAAGFTEVIPASACQLENLNDLGKAGLVDGSWVIDSTITSDTVELLCPVRIPHFAVASVTPFTLAWSHIEIFYRDPDGSSAAHSVTANLIQVDRTSALGTSMGSITSDSKAPSTTVDTLFSTSLLAFGFTLADAQHHVRVLLKQGTSSTKVRLTRVRLFVDVPG